MLVKTAKYLNINSDMNKPPLIHNIICKIQNLLPDTCIICQEVYCSKLEDTPFMACHVCGQEVHRPCFMKLLGMNEATVCPEINPHNLPGLHYLCPECEKSIIPPDASLHAPKKEADIQTQNDSNSSDDNQTQNEPIPSDDNQTQNDPNPSDDQFESENIAMKDTNDTLVESISENLIDESPLLKPSQLNIEKSQSDKDQENKKICIHYKRNQCKYGMRGNGCPFFHPERCKKLMQYGTSKPDGCNLGRKCPSFHPKICPSSITKHECFDAKCKLAHIKGTKRKKSSIVEKGKLLTETKMPNPVPPGHSKVLTHSTVEVKNSTVEVKNAGNADSTANTQLSTQSFLEMIRLLKEELTEAIETKIATAMSALPQYQPTAQIPQPHPNLYQHLQLPQFQMPQYQMMIPSQMFPPQKLPQMN